MNMSSIDDNSKDTTMSQASSTEGQGQHLTMEKRDQSQRCLSTIPQKKRKSEEYSQDNECSEEQESTPLKEIVVENGQNTAYQEEVLDLLRTILQEQKKLDERLMRIENTINENMIDKSELMAQNKMLKECKTMLRRVQNSIGLMTGDVQDELKFFVKKTFNK